MKKFACKISALLCAAAMLTALLPAFGVSAAAQTKKFLDPMGGFGVSQGLQRKNNSSRKLRCNRGTG